MSTQREMAALIPGEKCGVGLDKNLFAFNECFITSYETSNAIYYSWSPIISAMCNKFTSFKGNTAEKMYYCCSQGQKVPVSKSLQVPTVLGSKSLQVYNF